LDPLLNLTGLALWLGWRGYRPVIQERSLRGKLVRLSGQLRSSCGLALLLLLLLRSWAYWRAGVKYDWSPLLNLGVTAIPWNSLIFERMVAYSLASYLVWWGVLFAGLNVLSLASRSLRPRNPWAIWVTATLGWFGRWPTPLKILLPWVVWGGLWVAARPWLAVMGVALPATDPTRLWQQAAIMGAMTVLVWPLAIVPLLLLQFLNQFVYLGEGAWWEFVEAVSRWALRPFGWLPLQVGQFDFAPAVGALVWGAAGWFGIVALGFLFLQLDV
jgi:uncharacterized protein YggT (Ycf19 family)